MLVRVPRIDRRAVEKLRTVDEVRRDSSARHVCGAHRERIGAAVYGNSYILQAEHRLRARVRASHGGIERHEGADLVAELRQLANQRSDHVRETAGLGEGHHLGTQYANLERRHQTSLAKAPWAARRTPSRKSWCGVPLTVAGCKRTQTCTVCATPLEPTQDATSAD